MAEGAGFTAMAAVRCRSAIARNRRRTWARLYGQGAQQCLQEDSLHDVSAAGCAKTGRGVWPQRRGDARVPYASVNTKAITRIGVPCCG